jgi:hypothetical protein
MKKGQKKIDLLKYFFPIIIIISSFFLYLNFQFLVQNPIIFVLIPIWTISLSFAYSKKNIRKERIFTWLILITFLVIYFNFYASPFIIFAATPTPSPPSVSHSPEPQKGGSAITFSSNAAPGAAGEWIKLLICKNNTAGCVLNSQWGYRKPITISNSGSSALTDYQVLVTLDTSSLISTGKMRSNCGDIRFTDSDGSTLLNYWLESGCNSANTKIWVKVPSIPASSTKTIYVYYGNPSAASASNATNTMLWYDDFDDKTVGQVPSGWTTSGGTWAVSTDTSVSGTKSLKQSTVTVYGPNPHIYVSSVSIDNVSVEAKIRLNGQRQMGVLARRTSSNTFYFWEIELDDQRITLRRFVSGSSTILATFSYSVSANQWYKLRLDVVGNSLKGYLDDIIRASVTDTGITAPGNVGVHDNIEVDTNPHYVDDFIVRKLASPEPTTSVGAEEVPPTSNFIYTQSSAVSSNPSATYTCPSCQYSNNTYYGVAYSVNESVWTAFTTAKAFVCKMEVSQAGSCSCSSNTQCYNPCNINWGTYYDGYCYNSKCYDAIPGSAFGLSQSCLAGTILNHETSSQRYANVNGRLYYCKGSDNSVSPYPFVFSISPGSLAGNCKCLSDGKWACPTGIIPIRGGRIKII